MEHYLTYYHNSSLSLKNFPHFPKSKRTHFEKISYISRWNFSVCTLPRKKKFTPKKFREFSPYFKTTADQAIR